MSRSTTKRSIPRPKSTMRPTSWWLQTLQRRAERMGEEQLDLRQKVTFRDDAERAAAIKFFNAALRAEESGLRQAQELASDVEAWDPELATVLRLYGAEEGWHQGLITEYLAFLGGQVQPMGRVTRTFYRLYGKAKRMETIVLTNLMFETIGSTTYRLALGRVSHASARKMLTILTRDESFHVPLNVHFLRKIEERSPGSLRRTRPLFHLLFVSLLLLPFASRPKAQAFDRIGRWELVVAYATALGSLFQNEPGLGLRPPRPLLWLLGIGQEDLRCAGEHITSAEAAELAADRERVQVTAL